MRRLTRMAVVAALALTAIVAVPSGASAHPLGNFTINLYSRVVIEPGRLRVDYVVDMAEIPTFRETRAIDGDGDGAVSPAERRAYARAKAAELASGLVASGRRGRILLRTVASHARFRPGQGGLPILRLEAVFAGEVGRSGTITLRDTNYPGRLGWREITAMGADGEILSSSTVPSRSASDALLRYPSSLLSDPLRVTSARVAFEPGHSGGAAALPKEGTEGVRPELAGGAFARLATWTGLSAPMLVAALLVALALGVVHALLPGHGKTIMAAYLVGAGGRARQAIQVGLAVALMHSASVLALGLAFLGLSAFAPDRAYPWLTLVSGVAVLGLGAGLFVVRTRRDRRDGHGDPSAHGHAHPHSRTHPHSPEDSPLSRRALGALALAGGVLPSPTALVVLLSTVQNHRAGFGLALVGAFSVGMAAALVAVGLLALRAREVVARRMSGRLWRALPVASAAAIVAVGVFLVARAGAQL